MGTTDVLSRFILGCATIGNLSRPVSDDDAMAQLREAWNAGVRNFDTAPHYGVGLSEERLGRFLGGRDRSEFVLSTKVGRLLVPTDSREDGVEGFFSTPQRARVRDYSRDGVRRSIEESCERLGVDNVDIALIHDPDDFERDALTFAYPALVELRDEGTVKAIGLGMNQVPMLERFVAKTDIDCVLVAGQYSLLNAEAGRGFFQLCESRNVAVFVGGVFNSGILANPSGGQYRYAPPIEEVANRVRAIDHVCQRYGVELAAAALHYVLRNPSVTAVVVGSRSARDVLENIGNLRAEVPEALYVDLIDSGLVDPGSNS
ncbi:MAG: aldo/keto reductase [Acidimicrobiales bacterium]